MALAIILARRIPLLRVAAGARIPCRHSGRQRARGGATRGRNAARGACVQEPRARAVLAWRSAAVPDTGSSGVPRLGWGDVGPLAYWYLPPPGYPAPAVVVPYIAPEYIERGSDPSRRKPRKGTGTTVRSAGLLSLRRPVSQRLGAGAARSEAGGRVPSSRRGPSRPPHPHRSRNRAREKLPRIRAPSCCRGPSPIPCNSVA